MKVFRLLLSSAALFVATNLTGQSLQIVAPSCTQYQVPGTCAPCQCTWTTDLTEAPCGSLSFGTVEIGLAKIMTVQISNNDAGSVGNLQATVRIEPSGLTNNTAYWEILETPGVVTSAGGGNFTVAPMAALATRDIKIKFKPAFGAAIGGLPALLKITSNNSNLCYLDIDATNNGGGNKLDVFVALSGAATRTDINFVMVLDRSGSMSQLVLPSLTKSRLEILTSASGFFTGLLAMRGNPNDKLSIVKYDGNVDPVLPLAAFNATSAGNAITGLSPGGSTATGPALAEGHNQINGTPAGAKNLLVLFTDGEENIGPPWMMAGSPVVSMPKDPFVTTIGMGSDVNSPFQTNLHTFATNHHGDYYYVPEGIATDPALQAALHKTYLRTFERITGLTPIVDPNYTITLGTTSQIVSSAAVTSSDHRVLFSVFELTDYRRYYDLEIRSPLGESLGNGSLPSGVVGKVIQGNDYTIYSADFASVKNDSAFVGNWYLIIKPKNVTVDKAKPVVVPIGFAASAFSDLQIDATLAASGRLPGSAINFAAEFTESGLAVGNIKDIVAKLTMPDRVEIDLKPVKDVFGKWVVNYPHTSEAGTYTLFVRAKVQNSKGQWTTREQTKQIALSYPSPGLVDPDCISCNWVKIAIAIAFLLLIVILFRLWVKTS